MDDTGVSPGQLIKGLITTLAQAVFPSLVAPPVRNHLRVTRVVSTAESQVLDDFRATVVVPPEGDACRSSTKQRRLSHFHRQRQRGGVTRHCFDGFPAGGHAALAPAAGNVRVGRSGAEEGDQLAPLPLAQAGKRPRVSDPRVGEDAGGPDRADLRQHQEDVAHSRGPQRADGSGTRLVHEDAGASDETRAGRRDAGCTGTRREQRAHARNSCVAACCLSAYRRAGD
jgi:hypothetical protein